MQKISKRWKVVIIALISFYALLFAWHQLGQVMMHKAIAKFGKETPTVSAIQAQPNNIQKTLSSVGSVKAIDSADIAPELPGVVESINVKPGQEVTAGQVLITFKHQTETAALASSQASLDNAQKNLDRAKKLYESKLTSEQNYENALAALAQAKAVNAQDSVTLSKKTIAAPFAGIVGITPVSVGDYVQAGTTLLSLQQQTGPVYLNFTLPEKDFKTVTKGLDVNFTPSSDPTMVFKGTITGVDSRIDPDSRNFWVQATLQNDHPKNPLSTGMYGDVAVVFPPETNPLVPLTAIHYNEKGTALYLIDTTDCKNGGKGKVTLQPVTVGTIENNMASVDNITAGTCVVTAGQIKLYPDAQAVISGTGPTA